MPYSPLSDAALYTDFMLDPFWKFPMHRARAMDIYHLQTLMEHGSNKTMIPNILRNLAVYIVFQYNPSFSMTQKVDNWVFPKWSVTCTEFTEFRETDKSRKHELGLV